MSRDTKWYARLLKLMILSNATIARQGMLAAYLRSSRSRAANVNSRTASHPSTDFGSPACPLSRLHNITVQTSDGTNEWFNGEAGEVAASVKRNPLGVQLLSSNLHKQVFKRVAFPPPHPSTIQISRSHLRSHGLDVSQGSILPDVHIQLPPLQGFNISEHFYRIGSHSAEPWLSRAKEFASAELPPIPKAWQVQSGWTKYSICSNGSLSMERVDVPEHDGTTERTFCFDVETMPTYHPHAVMACAASPNAWYVWISPWLLEESSNPEHLIPFGHPDKAKVVVGHNVSYDRIRTLDEYNVEGTRNRFIDTMSLHVAVTGISCGQRPAWMKYQKLKDKKASETSQDAIDNDETESGDLTQDEVNSKRWEDLTSANSLADVAKLHCGIDMQKEIRKDFLTMDPAHIRTNISSYLDYCAQDVFVTHQVYKSTLSSFLRSCPHPASFSGILTMGSAFLPVNETWDTYIEQADRVYFDMQAKVEQKLKQLAEDALELASDESKWQADPWLSQLDWTPKSVKQSRGNMPVEGLIATATSGMDPPSPTPLSTSNPGSGISEDGADITPAEKLENPVWYSQVTADTCPKAAFERIIPLLLKFSCEGHPVRLTADDGWHYLVDGKTTPVLSRGKKSVSLLTKSAAKLINDGILQSPHNELALAVCTDNRTERKAEIHQIADAVMRLPLIERQEDPWLIQLDWSPHKDRAHRKKKPKSAQPPPLLWPKWYWEATKPKKGLPPGTLEVTGRGRLAPILLRLSWKGYPLFHSREHGWTFRVPWDATFQTRSIPLEFYDPTDNRLAEASLRGGFKFYKVPHKDGDKANVGSPLGKTFVKYSQDGTLTSAQNEAAEAFALNSVCSYWISVRDRVRSQTVVWQDSTRSLGLPPPANGTNKYGVILPQVITMGTVTRRAIEKTWLTASNAKENRVGSELKAMVRAPEGYAIVGADVDSEELWIASLMGDAQFGLHGASAIGWMTLEGTKAAGTDLHSKTASILGISRDSAKVFNYSRIYGAGMGHAQRLLLQANSSMLPEEAERLATNLYASTKGKNTHRPDYFERKFWHGGTESFLFNKLEEIALSEKPLTPALECGITYALSKEYLPEGYGVANYMTSRVNWVVQSSGVDYLHLLIVAMDYLTSKYDIKARYMISVHDELRYLVKEEDKYRAALALQIANLWTRCLFAYKLGMDDLPQGVAFFSAVDVDKVLRKEVDMPCVTPSHPVPIPPGESLDIQQVLAKTRGGSLRKDGCPMPTDSKEAFVGTLKGYIKPDCLSHRASHRAFLKAQAVKDGQQIRSLYEETKRREKWTPKRELEEGTHLFSAGRRRLDSPFPRQRG